MMTPMTQCRWRAMFGTARPRKNPPSVVLSTQPTPPITLNARNRRYAIRPTPATVGAKVRMIGTKRAMTIVFAPYFS